MLMNVRSRISASPPAIKRSLFAARSSSGWEAFPISRSWKTSSSAPAQTGPTSVAPIRDSHDSYPPLGATGTLAHYPLDVVLYASCIGSASARTALNVYACAKSDTDLRFEIMGSATQMDHHLKRIQRRGDPAAEGALVIFAKAPIPGQVKTRLCPPLTPRRSGDLHGSFVLDTLNARRPRCRNSVCRSIAIWPAHRRRRWFFSRSWRNARPSGCSIRKAKIWAHAWMECLTRFSLAATGESLIVGTDVPSLPLEITNRPFNCWTDTTSCWDPLSTAAIILSGSRRLSRRFFGYPMVHRSGAGADQGESRELGFTSASCPNGAMSTRSTI